MRLGTIFPHADIGTDPEAIRDYARDGRGRGVRLSADRRSHHRRVRQQLDTAIRMKHALTESRTV
jgi:hypothetical protein